MSFLLVIDISYWNQNHSVHYFQLVFDVELSEANWILSVFIFVEQRAHLNYICGPLLVILSEMKPNTNMSMILDFFYVVMLEFNSKFFDFVSILLQIVKIILDFI